MLQQCQVPRAVAGEQTIPVAGVPETDVSAARVSVTDADLTIAGEPDTDICCARV